jgi:hypothetical protein
MRNDATNSAIWQKRSLNAMLLDASYLVELPSSDAFVWDFAYLFDSLSCMTDTQQVGAKSGAGALGMMLKQLHSVDCPTWDDVRTRTTPDQSAHWFIYTTDCGPDVSFCKKILGAIITGCANCIFLGVDCYEHQAHLIVGEGLKFIDFKLKQTGLPWTYYSSLAKVTHVARDHSKAIFDTWVQYYDAKDAMTKAFKLFPTASAGRWGSIECTEKHLALVTDRFATVLCLVLAGRKARTVTGATTTVDEISADQTKAYVEMMGKWEQATMKTIINPLWWKVVYVMKNCRGPLGHLQSYMRQTLSDYDLEHFGSHYVALICFKAQELFAEFLDTFASPIWGAMWDGMCAQESQWLADVAVQLILLYSCSYRRRVLDRLLLWPHKIFRMIMAGPRTPCDVRRAIAQELLDAPESTLPLAARHIRSTYRSCLQLAASSGLPRPLLRHRRVVDKV